MVLATTETKQCMRCKDTKATCAFQKNSNAPDGLSDVCRGCLGIAKRESDRRLRAERLARLARMKEELDEAEAEVAALREGLLTPKRARAIKQEYGLSPAEYAQMYEDCGGKCKICRRELDLVVDHCHTTGRVRGLLCTQCNKGLGCFDDNPTWLRRARVYLKAAELDG